MSAHAYVIKINGIEVLRCQTADEAAAQAKEAAKAAGRGQLVQAVHVATGKLLYEAQEGRALRLAGGAQ